MRSYSFLILTSDDNQRIVVPDELLTFAFERANHLHSALESDALTCTIVNDKITTTLEKLT